MWYIRDVGAQPACWAAPRLHSCHTDAHCCKKTERLNIDWKLRVIGSYFYWFAHLWARGMWSPWMWKAPVFNMNVYYNGTFVTVTLHWFFFVFFSVTSRLIKACSVTLIICLSSHLYLFCFASAFTFCVPVDAYLIKLLRRRCADCGYEVRCEFKGDKWLMSKYSDDNREPYGVDWTPLSFVQLIKPARVWLSSQRGCNPTESRSLGWQTSHLRGYEHIRTHDSIINTSK